MITEENIKKKKITHHSASQNALLTIEHICILLHTLFYKSETDLYT